MCPAYTHHVPHLHAGLTSKKESGNLCPRTRFIYCRCCRRGPRATVFPPPSFSSRFRKAHAALLLSYSLLSLPLASTPCTPMDTITRTKTRAEARTQSLGDGDANEDWAPPAVPHKPTLSICLDTRRGTGRRRPCYVSVSSSQPSLPLTSALEVSAQTAHRQPTRHGAGPGRQQGTWVKKDRGSAGARREPVQAACTAPQEAVPDDNVAAFAAAIVDTLVARPPGSDAGPLCVGQRTEGLIAATTHNVDATTATSPRGGCGGDDGGDEAALDRADQGGDDGHKDKADDGRTGKVGKCTRANTTPRRTGKGAVRPYSRAPSSTTVLAGPEERQGFADALIAALVERPYGLTFAEVARLAERLSGGRCTGQDARLLIQDISRETVVVRRMMTPWFVPRVAVALGTRIALERVVAPAVASVLYTCGNGIDLQRLDVTVFARTGTSLRVHAANYARGSLRSVLSFVPQVVGRIEKIARRVVVYPTGHARAMALFAPLDDDDHRPDAAEGRPAGDDARVSHVARCEVTLARTIESAAKACAEVIADALEAHTDAAVVVDCRGPIGGRQERGPPVGMLQLVALTPGADESERAPKQVRVRQFDMVALHAEWMTRSARGPVDSPPTFFHDIGIADLLADARLVKVVFDSRLVSQTFWRCASCPMTRVFDMRLATLALGVGAVVPWSDNDTLASMGTVIDADMHELDAMAGTDAWAWHRRPLPLRARGAAARQAAALARAYQTAVDMHEAARSGAVPSPADSDRAASRAPATDP